MDKSETAFRTIGELSEELGVAPHILRYWETRFPQLRPLQRAGKRRYYRPDDVALARRIDGLLNREGYTIKGVQKLLAQRGRSSGEDAPGETAAHAPAPATTQARGDLPLFRDGGRVSADLLDGLREIRASLVSALERDY